MANKPNQSGVLHVAMFPWLAHGHIMPFFELSKLLAQKGDRISFISTPKNIKRVSVSVPENLSHLITLVSLPLADVEGLPEGTESTSELPIHRVPFLKRAYDQLELGLTRFLAAAADVDWIVHDFASHWIHRVASRLGVNSVYFAIFSATTMAFFGSPSEMLDGSRRRPEEYTVTPAWMESSGDDVIAYKLHEIESHWDGMDSEVSDFQRSVETIRNCDAVIVRTCPEFESDSLSQLGTLYEKPVIPIGLLPPSPEFSGAQLNDARWRRLSGWLEEREENSVVYIAFRTEVSLGRDLMHELAHGIEKSGLPFVWVVNDRALVEGVIGSDIIPSGFETRVSGRGLVWRGWAPQLGVLAHRSVGGFLTHCGWSSVIEALGLGRALILFPGESADQGLNSRLLSRRGVGLEIPRDGKTGSFTSDEVAESMRRVMVDLEGEPIRQKAKAMKGIFGNVELQSKYVNVFAEFLVTSNSCE